MLLICELLCLIIKLISWIDNNDITLYAVFHTKGWGALGYHIPRSRFSLPTLTDSAILFVLLSHPNGISSQVPRPHVTMVLYESDVYMYMYRIACNFYGVVIFMVNMSVMKISTHENVI